MTCLKQLLLVGLMASVIWAQPSFASTNNEFPSVRYTRLPSQNVGGMGVDQWLPGASSHMTFRIPNDVFSRIILHSHNRLALAGTCRTLRNFVMHLNLKSQTTITMTLPKNFTSIPEWTEFTLGRNPLTWAAHVETLNLYQLDDDSIMQLDQFKLVNGRENEETLKFVEFFPKLSAVVVKSKLKLQQVVTRWKVRRILVQSYCAEVSLLFDKVFLNDRQIGLLGEICQSSQGVLYPEQKQRQLEVEESVNMSRYFNPDSPISFPMDASLISILSSFKTLKVSYGYDVFNDSLPQVKFMLCLLAREPDTLRFVESISDGRLLISVYLYGWDGLDKQYESTRNRAKLFKQFGHPNCLPIAKLLKMFMPPCALENVIRKPRIESKEFNDILIALGTNQAGEQTGMRRHDIVLEFLIQLARYRAPYRVPILDRLLPFISLGHMKKAICTCTPLIGNAIVNTYIGRLKRVLFLGMSASADFLIRLEEEDYLRFIGYLKTHKPHFNILEEGSYDELQALIDKSQGAICNFAMCCNGPCVVQ
jgi:hypothetical protein